MKKCYLLEHMYINDLDTMFKEYNGLLIKKYFSTVKNEMVDTEKIRKAIKSYIKEHSIDQFESDLEEIEKLFTEQEKIQTLLSKDFLMPNEMEYLMNALVEYKEESKIGNELRRFIKYGLGEECLMVFIHE